MVPPAGGRRRFPPISRAIVKLSLRALQARSGTRLRGRSHGRYGVAKARNEFRCERSKGRPISLAASFILKMVVFDLLGAGFVLLAAVLGAWKGFAWQVASVISPVAGIALGWPLSEKLAPHLEAASPFDRWAAFAILFVLVSMVVYLLALGIRKTLERAGLRPWDRHLGFLAGGLKGFALAVFLTAAGLALFADQSERVRATRMGRLMTAAVRSVDPALPPAVGAILEPFRAPAPDREQGQRFRGARADRT